MNGLNLPSWVGLGAMTGGVLAIITSCWAKIKSFFWRCVSYAICQVEIKDDQTSNAVLAYLLKNYRRSKVYDRTYGASYEYTRCDGKYGMIPYEFLGSKTLIFWRGWLPLFFGVGSQTAESTPQNQNNYWYVNNSNKAQTKTLTFIRGTFDIEKVIKEACEMRNHLSWNTGKDEKQRRFFIKKIPNPKKEDNDRSAYSVGTSIAWYQEGHYRLLKHNSWDLGKAQIGGKKALDNLIFPNKIKKLIREIQIWRNNRNWYMERGLPWKRGWILYGVPGVGKTALVRAFAEDEDMPLFVFSLGELMNNELQKSWEEMQAHVPCIALFEDMDNVFHGRDNIAGRNAGFSNMMSVIVPPVAPGDPNSKQPENQQNMPKMGMLSFDCLLNCIDGVEKSDGIFTVITTNDINKIDPALGQPRKLPDGTVEFISSRPGRIDKAIELTYMEYNDKIIMAKRILSEYPKGLEQMYQFLETYPDLQETPAQFQERCSQLALSYFWIEQSGKEDLVGSDIASEIQKKVLTLNPGFAPKVQVQISPEFETEKRESDEATDLRAAIPISCGVKSIS